MASSSLYPPIVPYSMPAFVCQEQGNQDSSGAQEIVTMRVYFALSSYNRISEIKQAHVTVRYQQNNANALFLESYPAQIKTCEIHEVTAQEDPVRATTSERFYIELSSADMENGAFEPSVTYKVQIRFSDKAGDYKKISDFAADLDHFSEWSTVCLIRGIIRPKIKVVGIDDETESGQSQEIKNVLSSVDSIFVISYTPGDSEETLRNWRVEILDLQDNVLADSGWKVYNSYDNIITETGGSVSFEAVLPYQLSNEHDYQLRVTIETKNRYQEVKTLKFSVSTNAEDQLPGSIDVDIIEEDGYARIMLTSAGAILIKNLTLRRSSSLSNFTVWEDIANTTIINASLNWTYYDFTIESGVWYQYGIQTRDAYGRRGILKLSDRVMGEFEDAFLLEGGQTLEQTQQLKLRYNFNISNFVRTVAESKTDTIGSQYPFVRRNGNMYYREIQCTGLITAYMDNSNLFTNADKLYHNYRERYQEIREAVELVANDYDYTYEREFRRAVEAFLYDGKIKLFKSLQEGNILVKVMNVSMTPKQELGRLIYDFSATLVEVDDASFENLDKYGFITVGTYNPNITFETNDILKRAADTNFAAGDDVIKKIGAAAGMGTVVDGKRVDNFYLTYLRLEMESPPYLIQTGPIPYVINDKDYKEDGEYDGEPITGRDDIVLGWLFQINGEYILIEPPNNIYELKGDNVYITSTSSIIPMAPTQMQVDYVLNLVQSEDISRIASKKIYTKINGQYINHFKPTENITKTIWYKYYVDYYSEDGNADGEETYYTQLLSIFTIEVQAEPGTRLRVRSSASANTSEFIVGETGVLFLDPGTQDWTIEDLYMLGTRIDARYLLNKNDGGRPTPTVNPDAIGTDNKRIVDDDALADNNSTLIEFNQKHNKGAAAPENPTIYDYYLTDGDNGFMYYRSEWMPMKVTTKAGGQNAVFDLDCSVDAMIFYYGQVVKGIY